MLHIIVNRYTNNLPTYGAILLSADLMYVLLVQTYHAQGLWGFPKGKVEDEIEKPSECAIREVREETNYDITRFINRDWYVESKWNNWNSSGYTRLYIIPNVPMQRKFKARTTNEIQDSKWFRLSELFAAKNGLFAETTLKITANAFCMKNCLKDFLDQSQFIDQYCSIVNRRQQQYKLSYVNFNGRPKLHWIYQKNAKSNFSES